MTTVRKITRKQQDAIIFAFENGFFEYPLKGIHLTGIAREFGITHVTASERIRRGIRHIVEEWILALEEELLKDE